jgi:predicted PurR-regulated permease PerM
VRFERLMEQLVAVLALVVLAVGTLLVIAPFITTLLWGAILAYCTWGPYQRLSQAFHGHRAWAALFIILVILCVILGPMFYAGIVFSTHVPDLVSLAQKRLSAGIPPLPEWLVRLPYIGSSIDETWTGLAARNPELLARLRELAGPMLLGVLGAAVSVLKGLSLLALSVIFTAFFYLGGEHAAAELQVGMRRIVGARSEYLLGLIGGTVKGVVYGILGTTLAQTVLCAIGYWIAGLPSPVLLGLATFFLAVIPGGVVPIVVPGAIWLVQKGDSTMAVFLIVWSVVVAVVVDNILKPMIIGKSSPVPIVLILIGILGGAAAFGLLGVFIGPTLLAVAHVVVRDWTVGDPAQQAIVEQEPELAAPQARMAT